MDFLLGLLQMVTGTPLAWVLVPVLFLFYLNYKSLNSCQDKPESFEQAIRWLKEDNFGKFYRNLLGKFLDLLSRWLGDTKQIKPRFVYQKEQGHQLTPHNRFFSTNPFTPQSYEWMLRLAFIYPIVSFLIVWVLGGNTNLAGESWLGNSAIQLDTEQRLWIVLWAFFLPIILLLFLLRLSIKIQWLLLIILSALLVSFGVGVTSVGVIWFVFGFFFIPIYIGGGFTHWLVHRNGLAAHSTIYTFAFAFAVAVAVAAGAAAAAAAGAVVVVVVVVAAGAGAAAAAAAAAGVAGVAGVAAAAGAAGAGAGVAGAGVAVGVGVAVAAGAGAGAGVFYILLQHLYARSANKNRISIFWITYSLGLLLLSSMVISGDIAVNSTGLILFYLILPLLNAPLDWLSLSITRGLLHSIRHEHHGGWQAFAWALFDLVLALFFLLAVSGVMVLATGLMEAVTGQPFLSDALTAFENPETAKNYYWVYAVLLTTLIPTLLHFALAGAALTLWLPHDWRHRIANNLQHNHYKLWAASTYLTITPILGLLAPIALLYGLYLLLVAHGNLLGNMLLSWANLFATVVL